MMMRIESEHQLLESFRLVDRPEVEVPRDLAFPLLVKDYLAWTEASGHRVFLLFSTSGRRHPLGVVFRRGSSGASAGSTPPSMCEWCHSVRAGDGVMLLTATASSQRSVGLHLCRDLSCKERAEGAPGVDDLPQGAQGAERIRRILQRMNDFATRQLF